MRIGKRIKMASSGFFAFSLISLVNLFCPDPHIRFLAPIVSLVFVGLGFLTLKFPIFFCGLGSIFFSVVFLELFVSDIRAGVVYENPWGFGVMTLLLTYMIFVFSQGIFAGIKLINQNHILVKALKILKSDMEKMELGIKGKAQINHFKNK